MRFNGGVDVRGAFLRMMPYQELHLRHRETYLINSLGEGGALRCLKIIDASFGSPTIHASSGHCRGSRWISIILYLTVPKKYVEVTMFGSSVHTAPRCYMSVGV
jgi:hypothetical protein